ncbi:MAG: hypothetical protein ABI775_11675 [Pseudonocardiales bacterium]
MTDYDYPPTPTDYQPTAGGDNPPLKDKATDAAEAAKQGGTDVVQTAAEKAKDVAQETTKQARDLAGEARQQVRQQVGTQHHALVQNLRSLGDELGGMTANSEQSGVATEAVGQIRDRVHGAADWLERREPGDLVDEVRSFARRRPGAFLVGALAAGVVAGRLTRGVVAAHSDEASTSGAGAMSQDGPPTQPGLAPTTTAYPSVGYPAEGAGYAMPAGNGESGYGTPAGYGNEPGYGTPAGYGNEPGFGSQPGFGEAGYGAQPGYGVSPAGGYPSADAPENGEGWR